MSEHEKLDYVEFASTDISASKKFFVDVFDWSFEDFGSDYAAFYKTSAGIDGGFFSNGAVATQDTGSALIVFYSSDLEATLEKVRNGGAKISKEIFSFPGGRRFQFVEPGGNELAVWSDK